ncbi:hypothetical protein [Nocardioides panaciterrulae]|uniref:Mycothiol-dependent maleylpyruvate isomerase metal-binding domain-containing protein n=1 Tax=Nocardioides panaciterrulae TaxID=661492 RepID=A0A7Y9J993_9ACTN|nr:hypothetical protein [Nocardioides panaciterrulae]NYD40088.1 hypothetical protein [Nocardioides panaciterrulae]
MTDWGGLYRDHATALAALAAGLTDHQRHLHVPATPAWTVHDVYAHLAGGPADALAGRMDGAPGPEWTARHVGERALLPLDELVAELLANVDAVAGSVADSATPALVWDIAVHHTDLHEALGLGRPPEHLWRPVLDALRPRMLDRLPDGVAVDAPAYELFRGFFSRRSRRQMRAWFAPVPGDDELDALTVFGPRPDDQPQPA